MAARDLFGRLGGRASEGFEDSGPLADAPLGGTRDEALQRLQIGLSGLCAIILVVGIAGVIGGQAEQAENAAVPDAAPTTEPTAAPPQRDPLADAGVVPDIPAEPEVEETDQTEEGQISETTPDGTVIVPDTPPTEPDGQIEGQGAGVETDPS